MERRWIGGSCPNINCLLSKNKIWSAKGRASMIDPSDFTSTICSGAHRGREVYARSAVVAAARTHSGFVNGRF